MKQYASLHNHSDYSNIRGIDSINRITDLIDKAAEKKFSAIAITDHDVLSGHIKAIQHYKKINNKDLKLILGNEIYITEEGINKETYTKGDKFYHFLLLALNKEGHKQMREISTRAWRRSFFLTVQRTPTYLSDLKEIIGNNQGNIIATTACLAGIPATYYSAYGEKSLPMIEKSFADLENIFGKGNLFIEIQPSALERYKEYNSFIINNFWGKYPFVFTTDSHYLEKEDAIIHKQFLQSANKSRDIDSYYSNNYLMTFEEIQKEFSYIDAAKIEEMRINTLKIAERVEFYDLSHEQIVPTVPVDYTKESEEFIQEKTAYNQAKHSGEIGDFEYIEKYLNTDNEYDIDFITKVFLGFKDKINIVGSEEEVRKELNEYFSRINVELSEIWETSVHINQPLSKYFTTMAKMIDIIWDEGDSLVGVSRGSAAGFIINYLLGITQLDPLKQALVLPHWRFIHKDRPGLPDIDIDTEGNKRVKVFNKVQQYFNNIGGDLINVCTFGTEKSKSALRTAGRGLDIDDDTISYIVSMIPNERGFDWTLSQCMYGDEDHPPINKFQIEMSKNKRLWNLASKIEGLITRIGVHASGVVALNSSITEYNSVMKTSKGAIVTAFNLDDTEYMGGLKYDFLTINALDKIRTTLNLLLEDGVIDWEDSLRKTYDKYLLPKNLEYDSEEMWEMVHSGKIVDLFQFDTQVGTQAVRQIKPKNIAELSVANSVMRLMTDTEDGELPLNTYAKYKHDLKEWYKEMKYAGLNDNEIKIIEKHLLPLSGVADSQESAMMLVMDKEISAFDVTEANSLRKAIAKKKFDVLEQTKEMFYEKGRKIGTSNNMLDYVWNVQIMRQAGYSFSVLHTMGYSTIALQEMNLAYKFPVIYWNTACLSVNAGAVNEEDYEVLIEDGILELDEDDENKRESNKVQYGKVAAAINKFRTELGLNIALPDINKARFGFTPDADKNQVIFGLKGISKIGDNLIRTIISKRPYDSLEDFLSKLNGDGKTVISKDRVVLLIKSGAFDSITNEPREKTLRNFIYSVADQKKKLTLQNMSKLIQYNLLPEELDYEKRVYNFTKYLRKNKYDENYYLLDDVAQDFYYENNFSIDNVIVKLEKGANISLVSRSYWDSQYNSIMDNVRNYLKKNEEELLTKLNNILFELEFNKYAAGKQPEWELQSLGFYHDVHGLKGVAETFPVEISKIDEIPDLEVIGSFLIKGKSIPKYNIRHIIGTVLDKDKSKHTIILSTPEGVINVKLFQSHFTSLDKVNFKINEDGEKEIIQDSFFKKGTFLLVSGIKDGDTFKPKVYKSHGIDSILMFTVEEGKFLKAYEKL